MNKRALFSVFMALPSLGALPSLAHAADELDFLNQPTIRSERSIRSQQQVLWTLPFETTQFIPEQPTPAMRNAMAAQQSGRYLEAIAMLEESKDTSPEARLLLASYYMQGDQARHGQDILAALLQTSPNLPEAHALMAMAYLQRGKIEAALVAVRQAQNLGERSLVTRIATYVFQAQGKLEQASEVMAEFNAKSQPDALNLAREAELALSLGDQPRAAARIAAARAQTNTPATQSQTNAPATQSQTNASTTQSPYVQAVSGLVWLLEDQPAQAQKAFEEALQRDPQDAKSLLGLGLANVRLGRLKDGLTALRKATNAEPGSAVIQTYLGRALHESGHNKEAEAAYRAAIKLDPQDPTPWIYLAQSQTVMNQPAAALASLNQAAQRTTARGVVRGQYLLQEDAQTLQANLAEAYQKLGLNHLAWNTLTDGSGDKNATTLRNQAEILQGQRFAQTARRSLALQSLFNDARDALPVTLDVYGDGGGQTGATAPQSGAIGGLSGQASVGNYGALFNPQTKIEADAIVGNHQTFGEQVRGAVGGEQFGFSLAQRHYQSEGFSRFNGLDNSTWQGTLKWDVLDSTRIFLTYQDFRSERGETLYPADAFIGANANIDDHSQLARLGLRHSLGAQGELRALFSYQRTNQTVDYFDLPSPYNYFYSQEGKSRAHSGEFQYRLSDANGVWTLGWQDYREDAEFVLTSKNKLGAGQVYLARSQRLNPQWTLDSGLGHGWLKRDDLSGVSDTELRRYTPYLGLTYTPSPASHVRLAVGQYLGLNTAGGASLSPVESAGFVHVRQNETGKLVRSAALSADHRIARDWLVSGQASARRMWLPSFSGIQVLNETRYTEARLGAAWQPVDLPLSMLFDMDYERRSNEDYLSFAALDSVEHQRLRDVRLAFNWFAMPGITVKGELNRGWVDGTTRRMFLPRCCLIVMRPPRLMPA